MFHGFQGTWRDVARGEVGDRIVAGFKEQHDTLALGNPSSAEAYPHAPAQRLGVEQSLWHLFWHEEPTDCTRRERTLLPGESHCRYLQYPDEAMGAAKANQSASTTGSRPRFTDGTSPSYDEQPATFLFREVLGTNTNAAFSKPPTARGSNASV